MDKSFNTPSTSRSSGDRDFRFETDAEIIQELPNMRSVALMRTLPSLESGPKLGIKPPPLRIQQPPVGLKSLGVGPLGKTSSYGVQKEWSAITSVSAWNVKGQDLELVPVDYPLERTHCQVEDADASAVASRISAALASLSIETVFDCKKAKAKCKTGDFVSFRIRLYSGGESGQPVVVEVQRRCGSISSFRTTCRAILSAAEGKNITSVTDARVLPFEKKPVRELKCLQTLMLKEQNVEHEAGAALENAVTMLKSDLLDSNRLGVENLVNLTDPSKTSVAVALIVSKSIALGDEKHDIRDELCLLIDRDVFDTDAVDNERNASTHHDHLRHYALIVIANALRLCADDGCLETAVKEQQWYSEHLIPSLVDELKRASTNSCNAHQAACCLTSLLSCSDHARRMCRSHGGIDVVKEAHSFGEARHALLARETEQCLVLLNSLS